MQVSAHIKTLLLILITLLNPCVIKKNLLDAGGITYQQNQFKHNSNNLTCTTVSSEKTVITHSIRQAINSYTLPDFNQQLFISFVAEQRYRIKQSAEIILCDKRYLNYCQLKIPS